jgi:hypothetical protein
LTQSEAQQTAVQLLGSNAIAWADELGRFFFVKADKDPRKVGDLTMPFGAGFSWEDAFRNLRPLYAEKG